MISKDEAYTDLANAIVLQAVDDYKIIVRKDIRGKASEEELNELTKIETFIQSEYFGLLTSINPDAVLEYLRNYKGERKNGGRKKEKKRG